VLHPLVKQGIALVDGPGQRLGRGDVHLHQLSMGSYVIVAQAEGHEPARYPVCIDRGAQWVGELQLPAVQPGSSIMPGKVNPVMAESLMQVCAQVVGNDAAITLGGLSGNFELNVMMPMMAHNLLQSIDLLTNAVDQFDERCLQGLTADRERCEGLIEESLAMCTALAPVIGYDRAAAIAKQAHETGKTVREVALAEDVLPDYELERLLDPRPMTEAGIPGKTR
jgi:fumarate hydratase class II